MIGVEFVESKSTRQPLAKSKFGQIWNATKEKGILFGCGGYHGNVNSFVHFDNKKRNLDFTLKLRYCRFCVSNHQCALPEMTSTLLLMLSFRQFRRTPTIAERLLKFGEKKLKLEHF